MLTFKNIRILIVNWLFYEGMNHMKDIEVYVFDLDGTLYEDTHHFDYYAKRLCEKLDFSNRKLFEKDYKAVLNGMHSLKIGSVFDVKRDLILRQKNGQVTQAFTWEGESCLQEDIGHIYKEALQFDFHSMLNIGDLWWVPAAIARHYGIDNQAAESSFLETREYMMSPEFVMKEVRGFKKMLQQLAKDKKLILLTNSPEKDSNVILTKLGFEEYFDTKIFDGRKPIQTKEHLKRIKEKYQIDFHQMVSVGDNAINEITPAKQLGCKTVLIDPYSISNPSDADVIISNLDELVQVLKK